jgi:hypothetical protein
MTVESDDKAVTMALSAGALPAGVDPATVKITALSPGASPAANALLASYQIAPDGLQLNSPATISMSLTFWGPTVPMPFMYSSSKGVELLADSHINVLQDTEIVKISGPIGHFGQLNVSNTGFFSLAVTHPIRPEYFVMEEMAFTTHIDMVSPFTWNGNTVTLTPASYTLTGTFAEARDEGTVTTEGNLFMPPFFHDPENPLKVTGNSFKITDTFMAGENDGDTYLEYTARISASINYGSSTSNFTTTIAVDTGKIHIQQA